MNRKETFVVSDFLRCLTKLRFPRDQTRVVGHARITQDTKSIITIFLRSDDPWYVGTMDFSEFEARFKRHIADWDQRIQRSETTLKSKQHTTKDDNLPRL